jgi:hypothetical protein
MIIQIPGGPELSGVPEWVRVITKDADQHWWGWEEQPELNTHNQVFLNCFGLATPLGKFFTDEDWKNCIYTVVTEAVRLIKAP